MRVLVIVMASLLLLERRIHGDNGKYERRFLYIRDGAP
uniref:Putative secreted protein n=1 Tax=Ixodes scapularis TaxID=6945 RepID=Q4PML1_IXOSC|nr:putative secreted protein [Ixodes scapularis]